MTPSSPAPFARIELPADRGQLRESPVLRSKTCAELAAPSIQVLKELCGTNPATLASAAGAVLNVLLYKYTQQSSLWIQVRASGEWNASASVHCAMSEDIPFAEVMAQVSKGLSAPASILGSPNVHLEVCTGGSRKENTDAPDSADLIVRLEVVDGAGTLKLAFRSDLFHEGRMQVLLEHYEYLLQSAGADPQKKVQDLLLNAAADRRIRPDPMAEIEQLKYPPIGDLVAQWAVQSPDAPAVHDVGRSWTYAQLIERSGSTAVRLRSLGLGSGDVVAVTGRRSFGVVSAMLGVLRGGYVLLTLDPAMPQGRRQTMFNEAGAKAVVYVSCSTDGEQIQVDAPRSLFVDRDTAQIHEAEADASRQADAPELPVVDPEWPAYVFFTSGSTGTPKAVLGCHKGLSHFLCWQRATFGIVPADRAAQLTALSFDVVLRDMFIALTSGASLCIPDEGDVIDPARILPWLEREKVSVLHVVPSLARLWLNHAQAGFRLPHLRRVFFAGEPLMDSLVRRAYEIAGPDAEVLNLYGPTETTLAKCFGRVPRHPAPGIQPIGEPLPQTQALILNRQRQLCGLGEIGEIAIRTPFRTRGYLNAPELSAKVFVKNPFGSDPEDLIYLTGDNGRYRWDGVLEILGRMDNQIKIRGVRIELGEIETVVGRHPNVREVVVVARETAPMIKILVAYVVLRQPQDSTTGSAPIDELREYSRKHLPEIMVPAAFVALDALPLNANGKVDKKSLPEPGRSAMVATQHAPPTDALEASLKALWESVLRLDGIGIDDPFFDIGGHSLLGVQLVNTISSRLGLACTLPMLYSGGTIRTLAAAMRSGSASKPWTVLPLQPAGSQVPLFCISGIHLYGELAREFAPEIPVYGIYLSHEQELFRDAAEKRERPLSIEEIASDYLRAIRSVQTSGPYRLTGVSFGGVVAFEIAQQLMSQGEQVEFLGLLDTMLPAVVRRNWIRWIYARLGKARRDGVAALLARVGRNVRGTLARKVDHSSGDDTTATSEIERLWAMRDQAYREAELRYRPRAYPGTAVLVRARENFRLESDTADPLTYGWGAHIRHLKTLDVTGDHLGILRAPNVQELARGLRPYLDGVHVLPSR